MAQFTKLTSRLIPLPVDDVDTDQIIPARFLKTTSKDGLGQSLFIDWRQPGGPGAILDAESSQGAQVLLAGRNFGCGSSREHAPWALMGYGFRAIIASSFADIFRGNSTRNGLLPVEVDADTLAQLHRARAADPSLQVHIDLDGQTLVAGSIHSKFPADPFAKTCLLQGVDELGYILSHLAEIESHEQRRPVV